MRIGITGEKGFIARNLALHIEKNGHEFVSIDDYTRDISKFYKQETGETCVYLNSSDEWYDIFQDLKLDVIVHNAAVVGTDVVLLNPQHALMTNINGTQNIIDAANKAGMLNVYLGTTVIYDTFLYQDIDILEDSRINPRTNYAVQKYAAEMLTRNNAKEWLVMRPLFAYGGEGDMNSLIAKTLYGVKNNLKQIDMFLNPTKIKDYMHVDDFCNAIMIAINSDVRNEHFNITARNPIVTKDIISIIEDVVNTNVNEVVKWHKNTDYLGNHRLSRDKFDRMFGKVDTISLKQGIQMSWKSIVRSNDDYNPIKHLNEAKEKNMSLEDKFPDASRLNWID